MKKTKAMKLVEEYEMVEFESSSGLTDQFKKFSTKLRAAIKEEAALAGYELKTYSRGHFEATAFIQNEEGKIYYISIGDVRSTNPQRKFETLYRTAETLKDYTGGHNQYTKLDNLHEVLV